MSSEIPIALYAEVNKSREDRAEPGESYMENDEDVGPPQLPAKKKKKKQPPSISPYKGKALRKKSADRNDVQCIDERPLQAGASCSTITLDGAAFLPEKVEKPPKRVSKYCIMLTLATTVAGILIITTLIVSVFSITANSGVKTDDTIPALQRLFQTNFTHLREIDKSIAASLDHNSEELSELKQNYSQLQNDFEDLRAELECPLIVASCATLAHSCPSGYYWILVSNGSAVRVYCDMTFSCGNITGGWMRVAELNMTDTSQQCPSNLVVRNDNVRRCETTNVNCSTTNYSALNIRYREVCGRITAYQVGTTNAFKNYIDNKLKNITFIDSTYVDGVSLTHGNPKEHIWTFAAALNRNDSLTAG